VLARPVKCGNSQQDTCMYNPTLGNTPVVPPFSNTSFDNFFYGGAQASNAAQLAGIAAALAYDFAESVAGAGLNGAGLLEMGAVAKEYAAALKAQTDKTIAKGGSAPAGYAAMMASLAALQTPAAPKPYDQLVGASMLSDHMPILLQIPFA